MNLKMILKKYREMNEDLPRETSSGAFQKGIDLKQFHLELMLFVKKLHYINLSTSYFGINKLYSAVNL